MVSYVALRVKALESLLVDKGMVDPAAIDAIVDTYESKVGPRTGARVVARAWVDPAYKKRLPTRRRQQQPSPNWATAALKVNTRWCWKTHKGSSGAGRRTSTTLNVPRRRGEPAPCEAGPPAAKL